MADGGDRSLRHMLVSGGASLLSPLINFAAIPVITRLYGPADFGVWAVITSLSLIPGQVATGRYELATVVAGDEQEAGQLTRTALLGPVVFALAAAVLLLAAWPWMQGTGRAAALRPFLWAVPVLVLMVGWRMALDGWAIRRRAFTARAASIVTLALVTNATQVLAWYGGMRGPGGLVAGSVAGFTAATGLLAAFLVGRADADFRAGLRTLRVGSVLRRYRNFPFFSAPYTLLGNLRREGMKLVLGALTPAAVVGAVAFSWRLTNFPAMMFSNGIRPVLFERASRQGVAALAPWLERIWSVLTMLTLPGLVVFLFHADRVFRIAIGSRWIEAAPYARLLAVPAVVLVHTNWLDRLYDVLQRQRAIFALEAVFAVLSLTALAGGLLLGGGPLAAVALLAGVLTVYYLVMAGRLLRLADLPAGRAASRLLRTVLLGALLAALYAAVLQAAGRPRLAAPLFLAPCYAVVAWRIAAAARRERAGGA